MSRNFIGFGQQAYIGQPYTRPIKLGGIAGVCVPLFIQWISYGAATAHPNVNIGVELNVAACRALDQIRSVYIDNLGSNNAVYIYFPDTGATLAAKPNSEGWYPAYTNAKQVWVIGEGFLTGSIPQTYILLSNLPMQAAVNTEIDNAVSLWRASAVISRGNSIYNSDLGIPALGDITVNNLQNFFAPGVSTPNLWGTPYGKGFLYVTTIDFYLIGTVSTLSVVGNMALVIESTGISGNLFSFAYSYQSVPATTRDIGTPRLLGPISGMNLKLDATQTWQIRIVSATGGFNSTYNFISTFTTNPT